MKYNKYPKYKNSGIPWLGEIPEHWEVNKLKHTDYITMGQSPKSEDCNIIKKGMPFLQGNAEFGRFYPKPRLWSINANKVANKNDILLSVRAPIGAINFADTKVAIGRGLCAIAVIKSDLKFLYYCLLKSNEHINSIGTGSTFKAISISDVKNLHLVSPPKPEQTAIANFLDYKLEKIDRFITKKKQLIKLLNEQKAAIINQAVTKGIPNDELLMVNGELKNKSIHNSQFTIHNYKDSGIEWLGDIPESWILTRMKFLGDAIIGLTYSPSEMVDKDEGTLVLRSSNVQNGKITYDDCVYVTTEIPEKKRTRKGDILICSRNGSIKLVGKNALIDEKSSNESFGAFMTIIRSPYFEYLHYFFNSASFKAQSGLFFTSTINQLTTGVLNQIIVSIPNTIEEQNKIVSHIKMETTKIDRTIATTEKEIAIVVEYKTALISEAVTGKIDVRNYEL